MSSFNSRIISINGYHYTEHPVTKDLSPLAGQFSSPLPGTTSPDEVRYALTHDGQNIFIIDILTGEVIRTLHPEDSECKITEAQLHDAHAQALVTGTVVFKAKRAKRKTVNLHGRELMRYRMNDEDRWFMLLKATVVADRTLTARSGKLNFNFRDLGRILCMDEFNSEHLFSATRGNEYTMAAYRSVVEKFATVCRDAWRGKSLTPEYASDGIEAAPEDATMWAELAA